MKGPVNFRASRPVNFVDKLGRTSWLLPQSACEVRSSHDCAASLCRVRHVVAWATAAFDIAGHSPELSPSPCRPWAGHPVDSGPRRGSVAKLRILKPFHSSTDAAEGGDSALACRSNAWHGYCTRISLRAHSPSASPTTCCCR